jgi:hypothetical protein
MGGMLQRFHHFFQSVLSGGRVLLHDRTSDSQIGLGAGEF